MRINFFIILFLFSPLVSKGQDAIFSQFYHNPLTTNSALTGVFDGKYRFGSTLRSQWYNVAPQASYNTKSVFGDMRINVIGKDYFSIGIRLSS